MSRFRWTNPALPQTLQIAVIFLYISAFFGVLNGLINLGTRLGLVVLLGGLIALAAAAGMVRERRNGYRLAVAYALWDVLATLWSVGDGFSGWHLIGLLVDLAVVGLLLHPMSRGYYRTWFR